jgi:serine/threonine protein kinase
LTPQQIAEIIFEVTPQQKHGDTFQLLKCLAFLHTNRMVVRDLRPEHVLMTEDERPMPRLIHLGVMRSIEGTAESEPPGESGRVIPGVSNLTKVSAICSPRVVLQSREREL